MSSGSWFNKSYLKKLPFRLMGLLVAFVGALFLFVNIAHEVLWEKEVEMDENILTYLEANVVRKGLTGFMETVTYFASATFMQIGYGVLVLIFLLQKNIRRSVEIAAIGIGGFVINYCMKISFKRQRPPGPLIDALQNFSFPSGHATSAFIFYGLLIYLLWKSGLPKTLKIILSVILLLFSLLIGFSRMYLRVHYPSDVFAGFLIGFSWLLLAIWVMEKTRKKAGSQQMENTV
jgi:undecaprenyl-diphosphatase